MEVHAHTHTERKKWTHYLWEFLMLLLAVFCGFLAEYQLEHTIEHTKEKEYMRSMIEDLAQDTIEINRVLAVLINNNKNNDSLLNLLELPGTKNYEQVKKLYLLHFSSIGAEMTSFSQRTISQLKNSGGMRLIRKKAVADSITLYDNNEQYFAAIIKSYDEGSTAAFNAGSVIFDNRYIRHNFYSEKVLLLTYDEKVLRKYANYIFVFQMIGGYYKNFLIYQKTFSIELMSLIKKEYHLK